MRLHHLILILASHVLILVIGLPITSQPLASNPEHLTWDAWLMSPGDARHPDHKPKKITPKSIFITPDLNHAMNCPPDHKLDSRGRCIQIVEINHDKILALHLESLLASQVGQSQGGAADYDYDYEETDEGPFQLSLPLTFDTKTKDETQLFRGPSDAESGEGDKEAPQDLVTTTERGESVGGSSFSPAPSTLNASSTDPSSTFSQSEPDPSTTELSSTEPSSTEPDVSTELLASSTSEGPGSSSLDPEISDTSAASTPESAFLINVTETSSLADPEVTTTESNVEIQTQISVLESIERENITSFLEQSTNQTGILLLEDAIDFTNNTGEMEFFDENGDVQSFEDLIGDLEADSMFIESQPLTTTPTPTTTPEAPVFIVTPEPTRKWNPSLYEAPTRGHQKKEVVVPEASGAGESLAMKHEQTQDYLDNLDSNNRFVYHHITSSTTSTTTTTPSPDILEQIKEINRIVAETRLRRPSSSNRVRFPDPVSYPDTRFGWPYARQTPAPPTTTKKPLWWLPPANWDVDESGQKPMLLRFWERMPLVRDPSMARERSSSRSQRRENSRSPSESLYKEASAQDLYKVLQQNASRDWKHTNS